MNFYTKTLMAVAALSACVGTAAAADVQTVGVKTDAGQDIRITTQDDGTFVVTNGKETFAGADAANLLEEQGVKLTVSSTGTVLGLDFKNGNGAVTQKPAFVKEAAEVKKHAVAPVLPEDISTASTVYSQIFNGMTESRLNDKPVSR